MRKQIVRQIDETGRIVLPKPFREMLGLNIKDEVMLTVNNETIVLRKFSSSCAFCGAAECAKEITKLAE